MYTIFFEDTPIYLTNLSDTNSCNHFFDIDNIDLIKMIDDIESNRIDSICFYDANIDKLWKKFTKKFKIIEAAGGVVLNDKKEILFIYRNHKWDIPKGKVEKGETIENAAIREVIEECGIEGLKLIKDLDKTYHIYKYKGNYILKITHWFLMNSNYNGTFTPQLKEGITEVAWIPTENLTQVIDNTYANIKLIFLNLHSLLK